MAEEGGTSPRVNPVQAAVAVAIVGAVLVGYLVATSLVPTPVRGDAVRVGDEISVDYVAFFEDGRVFDTTLQAVAENNVSYPKAASFQPKRVYRPLTFTVAGGDLPGQRAVIAGFEEGILEPDPMRVGETREIVVPQELGYGPPDEALVEVRPLTVELPQFETWVAAEFLEEFDLDPAPGLTFLHPVWQWPVTVLEEAGNFVTLMHAPETGFTLRVHNAWPARVVQVDTTANGGEGLIVVRHLLDADHVDRVQAEDGRGTFRVVAVDPEAGTYTVDYNREVVGKTLVFRVTLVSVDR